MKIPIVLIIGLLLASGVFMLNAQINFPRISPACTIIQKIGLTEVRVDYARPSMRGRKIIGKLVPYGRIWRVGANESTKLKISDSLRVNGQFLPKGTYALYAFPTETEWIIVFHKNTSHWGDGRTNYDPAEDALRIKVKPQKLLETQESFTIEFNRFSHQSAWMEWSWENTKIAFKMEVDTHAKVMAEIAQQIENNPTAATYYQAARYLQEEDRTPQQARQWLIKAQELAGDKYYIHRVRSLVEAKLGNYEVALKHAQKSKAIAAELGKDEFVRMNDANIQKWQYILSTNSTNK